MISSLKKINCFVVILGLFIGAPIYVYANNSNDIAYKDRFLFCLNKDVSLLEINKDTNILITNDLLLNIYIQENNIVDIERWLPHANDNDVDGDVHLNRIYRAYIDKKSRYSIDQVLDSIIKLSIIHSAEYENIHRNMF